MWVVEICLGFQVFIFSVIRMDHINLILGERKSHHMHVNSAMTLSLRALSRRLVHSEHEASASSLTFGGIKGSQMVHYSF